MITQGDANAASSKPPDATELAAHRTTLAGARSHLANERTHLAYLRTAISLIGFGITLNRFSIYLTQAKQVGERQKVLGLYDVENVGIGMAVAGLLLLGWSLHRFSRTHRELERGVFTPHFKPVVAITLVLFALGGLSTIWLLLH
jgi:putative membrane protein